MKHLHRWLILLSILLIALLAPSAFAGAPTGAGPNDPLRVTGNWQILAPNASLWFYFDYTGDRSRVEVDLDDYGASNVQLAIFTPALASAWLQDPTTRPIGWGTPPGANSAAAIHDLVWLGAFNFPGRFFAVVTNNNLTSVSFRLTISGTNVSLGPTPTPTPGLILPNPFATPIQVGTLQGRLLFQEASGGNIYTVNGDGSNLTRVSYGLDPNWSPDGRQIAFSRWNDPAGLFIASADGSNEQRIFGAPQVLSPQWSPDGTRIAFTRQKGGSTSDSQFCFGRTCFTLPADPHWKIGVVDAASSALTEPSCTYHCFSPTWSSNNHTLAYADAASGILGTDTTATPISLLFNRTPQVQSAAWSPDGTKIAFQARQHDHWDLFVMNVDGSNAMTVTQPDPLSFMPVNNVTPAWSPDSKQILFLSDRGGKWEFFVVNADGTNLRQVLKSVTDAIAIYYNFSNERVVDWTK
jgi:TolB protein